MDVSSPASTCTLGEEAHRDGCGDNGTIDNMDIASPASTCTITEEVQEIEAGPTARLNDEGTIDHVLDILNAHSHSVILVGLVAHRWMGCASSVDDGFDLVLRTSQLPTIVISIVETGLWTIFDSPNALEILKSARKYPENVWERRNLEHLCETDAVLKWEGIEGIGFSYMRLWTEETYHIDVDTSPLVEVPELFPWNKFLAEKEFHPSLHRDDGWFYGPNTLDDVSDRYRIFSTIFHRAKGAGNTTPINFLIIPAYLDALVYQTTHQGTSKQELVPITHWQIRNLTRYLFLELPHQRDPLLFEVNAETENYLHAVFLRVEKETALC